MLALVTDAFGGRGGIAQANRDLLTSYVELGEAYQARVVPRLAPDKIGGLPDQIFQVDPQASKAAYAFASWKAISSGEKWDVLFCGHLRLAGLSAWLSARSRVPLWVHLHGIEAWDRPPASIRRALGSARLVTAVSRYTRRRVIEWSGLEPWKIRVLPDAVGAEYTPGPKSASLIDRWSIGDRKVLLTVARMSASERYKGHECVFRALGQLLAAGGRWVYVIAGEGDDRSRLEREAAALGLREAVRFVGRVDEGEKLEWFRTADVLAMPSSGEGFGIVFLEAVRSGARIVAGEADGSRDPLRDGLTGRLVPVGNPEALVRAIGEPPGRATSAEMEAAGVFLRQRQRDHLRRILEDSR